MVYYARVIEISLDSVNVRNSEKQELNVLKTIMTISHIYLMENKFPTL